MKVHSVAFLIVIIGLCVVFSVVILTGISISIIKIEIPWIIGTFSAIGAIATAVVAFLAWRSNKTAIWAISQNEEQDRIRSKHSIFTMERLAYELISELIEIEEAVQTKGEQEGIPEKHRYQIPIQLPDKAKNTSRSFINLFQAVGSFILDEQRYDQLKYTTVKLTNLLQKKDLCIEDVKDALTAVTYVLHIDDDPKDEEE